MLSTNKCSSFLPFPDNWLVCHEKQECATDMVIVLKPLRATRYDCICYVSFACYTIKMNDSCIKLGFCDTNYQCSVLIIHCHKGYIWRPGYLYLSESDIIWYVWPPWNFSRQVSQLLARPDNWCNSVGIFYRCHCLFGWAHLGNLYWAHHEFSITHLWCRWSWESAKTIQEISGCISAKVFLKRRLREAKARRLCHCLREESDFEALWQTAKAIQTQRSLGFCNGNERPHHNFQPFRWASLSWSSQFCFRYAQSFCLFDRILLIYLCCTVYHWCLQILEGTILHNLTGISAVNNPLGMNVWRNH